MSDQVLKIDNVSAAYGSAVALQGITMHAPSGSITGVAGPNGAGKSTLLKAVSGVVSISRGEISFDGRRLAKAPHRVVRAGVVHVPEGRRMLRGLSVLENLRVGALAGHKQEADRLEFVVSLFPELEKLLNKEASRLSGGEQQMVAIGRGLMASPRMMMVDELSLGLAPQVVRRIAEALRQLSSEQGIGVVVVDQSLEVLRKVVDSLVVIVHGRVVLTTTDVAGDFAAARDAYLGSHDAAAPPI